MENKSAKTSGLPRNLIAAALVSLASLSGCAVASDGEEGATAQTEQAIGGLILAKYQALNSQHGPLGAILQPDAERDTAFGTGRFNTFANGRILWKWGAPEAFSVYGGIDGAYGAFGWEWSKLGFPTKDEYTRGTRRETEFEFGRIYWKSSTGAWPVLISQAASDKLVAQNWPRFDAVASLTDVTGDKGACLRFASGAGFSPGSTVTFRINDPDSSTALLDGTATVSASGSFFFNQQPRVGNCIKKENLRKINSLATIEARDSTGRRAVTAVFTSNGVTYPGAF